MRLSVVVMVGAGRIVGNFNHVMFYSNRCRASSMMGFHCDKFGRIVRR